MIIVNARFLCQKITGVQRYAIEISKALREIRNDVVFVSPLNVIHDDIAEDLKVIKFGRFSGHLWEQFELPKYLSRQEGSTLIVNLTNTGPIFYKNKIYQLHDIAYIRYPQTFSLMFRLLYRFLVPINLFTASRVITDSGFSKSEIMKHYKIDDNKIGLVPCAPSKVFYQETSSQSKEYVLAVSSINYQKNFKRLIEAFLRIDSESKLIVVGEMNNSFKRDLVFEEMLDNDKIEFTGRVTDQELRVLYSNAKLFIYPSLYEGFGIPPLEAQACGCPVLSSNAASLPEVLNDSAEFCEPTDVDSIRNKIEYLLSTPSRRAELTKLGLDNSRRFDWTKAAILLNQEIERVL